MENVIRIPVKLNSTIAVKRWGPHGKSNHAVIGFHGMVSNSAWFSQLGECFAENGVTLFVVDRRGSGESSHSPLTNDPEIAIDDMKRVLAHIKKDFESLTLFLWCGGAVYGLPVLNEKQIDRVFFAAPGVALQPSIIKAIAKPKRADGYYDIPFDAINDFSEVKNVKKFIAAEKMRLNKQPAQVRELDKAMIELAKKSLGHIKVPAHCLLAKDDKIIENEMVRNVLKGTPITEMEGGHALVLENPQKIARLVIEFEAQQIKKQAG